MKVTVERATDQATQPPPPPSDLPSFPRKPPRRKSKTFGAGVRLKRDSGAPSAKRSSRPETPLLRWKFDEDNGRTDFVEEEKSSGEAARKSGRKIRAAVSARKLAAGLWRLRLSEFQTDGGEKVGLQRPGGIHCHHVDRVHASPARDLVHSPHSVSGPKNGLLYKMEPSSQFSNYAMEGATKWDPEGWKIADEVKHIFGPSKPTDHRASDAKVISALEADLDQARSRINELEADRRSSKKKLEQFLRKLSEERAAWRSREHEKVRAIIDDMKTEVSREKKNRQRLEIVNSKLVNELADVKLSAKCYLQEYEKERKGRELIEEVCDELAKEIGEDKAEVEALKRESMKLREEVDEERKMLQMAEVWREERVQMKLVDAKVMLEEKYSQMNKLIESVESYLTSRRSSVSDSDEVKKAEFLLEAADSINIQDVRELTYEPPSSDDIFSVFDEVNFGESNERGDGGGDYSPASHASKIHMVSPEVKTGHLDNQSGEDASEWETVSQPEDQGSSYSPDRASNVSRPGMEWDRARDYKIISVDGKNGRLSNGRLSNGAIMSPDEWSTDSGNSAHMNRAMKGCIEWPRGGQKNSLKARLLEARMESQKVQLRQVLKQKI